MLIFNVIGRRASACATGVHLDHPRAPLVLVLIAFFAFAASSDAGLKIYYLRHAEGGHNVVKEWAKVPKEQRPDYVGNGNVFTPKGKTQVAAATEKLRKYHFDFIGVSSMWRTRNTVLPYLKAVTAKGEIWPELHEFGGGAQILAANLPVPTMPILGAGPRVELPPDEAPYFTVRPDAKNDFKLPSGQGVEREAATQLVVKRVVEMIRERFGGTDKTILLVGHGNSGRALLRRLTNQSLPEIPSMTNAELWMVEEQPGGSFQLAIYNDSPCGKNGPKPAPRE
jgi:broad specificity phosphatase PhoE